MLYIQYQLQIILNTKCKIYILKKIVQVSYRLKPKTKLHKKNNKTLESDHGQRKDLLNNQNTNLDKKYC